MTGAVALHLRRARAGMELEFTNLISGLRETAVVRGCDPIVNPSGKDKTLRLLFNRGGGRGYEASYTVSELLREVRGTKILAMEGFLCPKCDRRKEEF